MPRTIRKRNGTVVEFDSSRIKNAVAKAFSAVNGLSKEKIDEISGSVCNAVVERLNNAGNELNVEQVQDAVEFELMKEWPAVAKAYILYRQERSELRAKQTTIPPKLQILVKESKNYFRNPLSEFVYYRTYSRWKDDEQRRETWIETVDRFVNYMHDRLGDKLTVDEYGEIRFAILKQEVMPSMRLLWSAGKAVDNTNMAAYNCSFIAPTCFQDYGEVMYISMCGTGVGFSVESQNVDKFPAVEKQDGTPPIKHVIKDSKEGWSDALVFGITKWYEGKDVEFDFSKIRPQGSRIKVMGGRSAGPEPLRSVLNYARSKILSKQGKKLEPIDVHDLICKIGEVVVMGGVRRTALISLSDLKDEKMRNAKAGQFYLSEPQRSMANNSAVYTEKPTSLEFMEEWLALAKSGSGERGIFNRGGLKNQLPERRWKVFENHAVVSGVNPCSEIYLRSKQLCNLSEVIARQDDTPLSLMKKIRIASILGTYQSTMTDFKYVSPEWKENCDAERLLGVSITGQWDCPLFRKDTEIFTTLKEEAIKVNQEYAKRFGINASTCVTCVKPSGTVSQLVDSASGLHPRHSKYYIRRIRISVTDSLFKMMKDQKVPYYPETGQTYENMITSVFEFPIKAPEGAILRKDLTALQHLEYWKILKTKFTEHNPSVTISVGEDEWIDVMNWVYSNWEIVGGLSFLPKDNHIYPMAPYEEITKERYEEMVKKMPNIDFAQILLYEKHDETQGSKELACTGDRCELR